MIKMLVTTFFILISSNSLAGLYTYDCSLESGDTSLVSFDLEIYSANEIVINDSYAYEASGEIEFMTIFKSESSELGTLLVSNEYSRGVGFFSLTLSQRGEESNYVCSIDWSPF